MSLTYGSVFAGIGGLDLGMDAAGFDVRWQIEINPWARAVLARHWPTVRRYSDVRAVGANRHDLFTQAIEPVDVIVGGFPCQDVSAAGRRIGLRGARSGLWREMRRLVAELRPRAVLIENVPGLIRRGLDSVVADLDALNYSVEATRIEAADIGAPHRRQRLFVLAYATRERRETLAPQHGTETALDQQPGLVPTRRAHSVSDPQRHGLRIVSERIEQESAERWNAEPMDDRATSRRTPEPRMVRTVHGLPAGMDRFPSRPGTPAHDYEPLRQVEDPGPQARARIAGLGNAIVPAVAYIAAARVRERLAGAALEQRTKGRQMKRTVSEDLARRARSSVDGRLIRAEYTTDETVCGTVRDLAAASGPGRRVVAGWS